jgi:hypothetical protein
MILSALSVHNQNTPDPENGVVVLPAPERSYIETRDSDGDGIKDWEEGIQDQLLRTIPISSTTLAAAATYTPPTTLTGKFSEAFLQDYLQGKMRGQDFSDPTAFVGTAIEAIDKNTTSRVHTKKELTIVPTTPDSLHEYGNELVRIMNTYSGNNENEAVILQEALKAQDEEILKKLDPILESYAQIIADSVLLPVPEDLVNEHLVLLNSYESILTDVTSMRVALQDPLFALSRIRVYEKDVRALYDALTAIADQLDTRGVVYLESDYGVFLHKFVQ